MNFAFKRARIRGGGWLLDLPIKCIYLILEYYCNYKKKKKKKGKNYTYIPTTVHFLFFLFFISASSC